MAFPVTVVNPSAKPVPVEVTSQPIQVSSILTAIQSFTYAIEPTGNQPLINFGFLLPSDSLLETVGYHSATSPGLSPHHLFSFIGSARNLGRSTGRHHRASARCTLSFVLSPLPGTSAIAFTAIANINVNQTRIDIAIATPDGTNIPASAAGALTFQFKNRY